MSYSKAEEHLRKYGLEDRIIRLSESSATVELAAQAVGVQAAMIAKTLSFLVEGKPVLVIAEGTARIDNHKFKDQFHTKAKMIPAADVEKLVGHAPGGVCPFGRKEGVAVYLDASLRKFDYVYPAAGDDHSAVKLTVPELLECSEAAGWVDVCKEPAEKE